MLEFFRNSPGILSEISVEINPDNTPSIFWYGSEKFLELHSTVLPGHPMRISLTVPSEIPS